MGGLLVLLRHGESRSNREDRFTGWQDVGLTKEGREGAQRAARLLAEAGLTAFDVAFSSRLERAAATLRIVLDELGHPGLPVRSSPRLNERHYGALQGLEKAEAEERYGEERVRGWRRGYRARPPAAEGRAEVPRTEDSPPLTESLEDVSRRVLPYWFEEISRAATGGARALVVAHGNSLRALVKHLEGLSEDEVEGLEIPPARPLVYELDDRARPTRRYRLEEDQRARRTRRRSVSRPPGPGTTETKTQGSPPGVSGGLPRGGTMGQNRWSDIEERKRIETKAKAGDEVGEAEQGDASSRLKASEGPSEDEEKRRVVEKLSEREQDS